MEATQLATRNSQLPFLRVILLKWKGRPFAPSIPHAPAWLPVASQPESRHYMERTVEIDAQSPVPLHSAHCTLRTAHFSCLSLSISTLNNIRTLGSFSLYPPCHLTSNVSPEPPDHGLHTPSQEVSRIPVTPDSDSDSAGCTPHPPQSTPAKSPALLIHPPRIPESHHHRFVNPPKPPSILLSTLRFPSLT